MWRKDQIKSHQEIAQRLHLIMQDAFRFIGENQNDITEQAASQYTLAEFKKHHLILDSDAPIVAFGRNTANVHHFPGENSARLEPNSPILIDIWARASGKGSPYADITWMGYCGVIASGRAKQPIRADCRVASLTPRNDSGETKCQFERIFAIVVEARDSAIMYLTEELQSGRIPTGQEVDDQVRKIFASEKVLDQFLHATGHSIGLVSPHGRAGGRVGQCGKRPLEVNLGYTIEPGLYFTDKFGVRSEIDFYITSEHKLVVTTPAQESLAII